MKRIFQTVLLLSLVLLTSCKSDETYADKKAAERDAIDRFIAAEGIEVIDDETFEAQGQTTDVASNQFVRFSRNGVYMQIVRPGCGDKLEEKKSVNVLCRFMEKNIQTDSVLVRNDQLSYMSNSTTGLYDVSQYLDVMSVTRNGTTITASFVKGMMYQYHASASVPAGWLVPLNYIRIGRPDAATANDDEIAKVRLIVPHSQGTPDASSSVVPCYYEITYVRER